MNQSIGDGQEFNKENYRALNAATGAKLKLQMQDIFLSGRITLAGAHLVVKHTFTSAEEMPIEVVYSFVLPRDAALRQFRVVGKGFCCRSELMPVKAAEEKYEEGLSKGHLSVLSKLYRDGYVNLNVGNIKPGETVAVFLEIMAGVDLSDDGFRFRFPFTLAPCYHPQACVSSDGNVGEIELPADEFGDVILPPVHKDVRDLHTVGFDLLIQVPDVVAQVSSPSHATGFENIATGRARVQLATGHDVPNRDIVLDLKMKAPFSGVLAGTDTTGFGHFAAIIASSSFGRPQKEPRRLVFVFDRSGSMGGEPIRQAGNAVRACISALDAQDEIGFLAFDNQVTVFRTAMCKADDETREALGAFVGTIGAQGGTELFQAFNAAAGMIGDKGGDIFVLTDGEVSGTETIIAAAKSAGIRIHCLGIGSASQDRFIALLARETGGISRFVTPNERVDMAALKLFAAIGVPVACEVSVKVSGIADVSIAPVPQKMVFSGHPLLIMGSCSKGSGTIVIEWLQDKAKKELSIPLNVEDGQPGSTLRLLRGSRLITDLEAAFQSATPDTKSARKEVSRMEKALEVLGTEYGLANRAMALVAVVKRTGDQSGQVPKTMVVPVGMPAELEFDMQFAVKSSSSVARQCRDQFKSFMSDSLDVDYDDSVKFSAKRSGNVDNADLSSVSYADEIEDVLIKLVAMIQADGGMPGDNEEERVVASLLLLLGLYERSMKDTFGQHIGRLLGFLKTGVLESLGERKRDVAGRLVAAVEAGRPVQCGWAKPLKMPKHYSSENIAAAWNKMEKATQAG